VTTNSNGQAGDPAERPGATAKEEAVAASTLESAPADQKGPGGDSFYNPALVGSGTIMPDGTYGAPLPDPNVKKLAEDPAVTTDTVDPVEPDASTTPKKTAAKRTSASS
jgi:hypothetical protein